MALKHLDVLSRRDFLVQVMRSGAGLTLGLSVVPCVQAALSAGIAASGAYAASGMPLAFLSIQPDNTLRVVCKHLEMGQGTYTGMATLVAEELDADWSKIEVTHAPADARLYANLFWGGMQGTGGSTAIANAYQQMREVGAKARVMLMQAAAKKWGVPLTQLTTDNSFVLDKNTKQRMSYGELSNLAQREPVPTSVSLKSSKAFRYIGQPLQRKDKGKINGTAIFTQDIVLPDMLTAVVAHAPRFGATVKSFDDSKAKNMAGVVDVIKIPTGVAVLAQNYWVATRARQALSISWDNSNAHTISSEQLTQGYHKRLAQPGKLAAGKGELSALTSVSHRQLRQDFVFPYLAHATMEPMNCVVHLTSDSAELWYGCQLPTADQAVVAKILDMKVEQVKINTVYAGGSFGRRANPAADFVAEGVHIAKAYGKPRPIKLVWSREDDMRGGYYRPLYVHRIEASLSKSGQVSAWRHRIVGQSILKGTPFAGMINNGIDVTSVEGATNMPYDFDNQQVELDTTDEKVPVQWWRSVGSTHTAFSIETVVDQLATEAGQDPFEFRRAYLKRHPRHLAVLEKLALQSSWSQKRPSDRFLGLALHESFNSVVGQVVELVRLKTGKFRVDKVWCAVDCGMAINPDIIRAQMEGGIGYGLSAALFSSITLDESGQVSEGNFDRYQVVRMRHMPRFIDVAILPSDSAPTGVGEPGTPPIAPAIANALYAATGKRVSELPLGSDYF